MSDIHQIQKTMHQIQKTMHEQRRRAARDAARREYEQAAAVLRLQLEMQKKAAEQWRIMHLPRVEIEV